MGVCASVHPCEECSICFQDMLATISLPCGHTIHAPCLLRWWYEQPHNAFQCPMCRAATTGCYMVLTKEEKQPLRYYRKDDADAPAIMISANDTDMTNVRFVTIPDRTARDMAILPFIRCCRASSPMSCAQT